MRVKIIYYKIPEYMTWFGNIKPAHWVGYWIRSIGLGPSYASSKKQGPTKESIRRQILEDIQSFKDNHPDLIHEEILDV